MACILSVEEIEYATLRTKDCVAKSLTNRYLYACTVYVFYSSGMVMINTSDINEVEKMRLYIYFNIIHAISAMMYIWTWRDKGWFDLVLFPEYLNAFGAALYLWSRFDI